MAIDKRYDLAKKVWLEPVDDHGDPHIATSASLTVYDKDGDSYQTPTVTLPTATDTVTAASSTTVKLRLGSGDTSGFTVGERIRVASEGAIYAPRIARKDSANLYLETALPSVPEDGAAISAIRLHATIAAGVVGDLGLDYRLEWQWTSATDAGHAVELLDVVRWPWTSPVTADTVRDYMATVFQVSDRSDAWCASVARRVGDMLQQDVRRAGRREHLLASSDVFRELGNLGQTMVLAELGYAKGEDSTEAMRAARYAYEDRLERVLGGLTWHDDDLDGVKDDREAVSWMTFTTRR